MVDGNREIPSALRAVLDELMDLRKIVPWTRVRYTEVYTPIRGRRATFKTLTGQWRGETTLHRKHIRILGQGFRRSVTARGQLTSK